MKVNHKLLEVDKELKDEQETKAFIHGLCDELFLHKVMLQYYIAATLANTRPDIFHGLRLSIEGSVVEWILTGNSMENIWDRRQKQYETLLKKIGAIKDKNTMEVQ
mgnify:FL=1